MTAPTTTARKSTNDTDHDQPDDHQAHTTAPRPEITNESQNHDKSKSKTHGRSKNNDHDKSNGTTTPTDKAHQCIARSDGVVRALRARTGDQQQPPFKIVSEGF